MTNDTTIRAAAVHGAAPFLDLAKGVETACDLIAEAGRNGAELIAFPEAYLPGYPYWIWSHTAKYAAPSSSSSTRTRWNSTGPSRRSSRKQRERPARGW